MGYTSVVSPQEWDAARRALLVKEKELTRAHDALAAERRRMPRVRVERDYAFEGPDGPVRLIDLFEGRRQLVLYRFFFEEGVGNFPHDGCPGCSLMADQDAHPAHIDARDITLVYASRAPQADIARYRERMGWKVPWYTMTDDFDKTSASTSGTGPTSSCATARTCTAPTSSTTAATRRSGAPGATSTWRRWGARRPGRDSPAGYPQQPPYQWWRLHDEYGAAKPELGAAPRRGDPRLVEAHERASA